MKGFLSILQSQPLFAIHPQIGMNMLMYALMVMKKQREFDGEEFNLKMQRGRSVGISEDSGKEVGTVFVQQLHGTLLAQDQFCGPIGMNTLARRLEHVAQNPEYDAVVLDIQSPGGQVLGTEGLANAIAEIRENKPVVAFVNGMAASAGYRLAVEADEIFMDGATSEVGSVGVMLHYLDFTEFMKKEGIAEVKIMSTLSPDKNKFNYSEPGEEDIQLFQSDMLDPLANEFQQAVMSRRPGISADALTGNMYLSAAAIELGMADKIGGFKQAVERAYELSQSKSQNDMGIFNKDKKQEEFEVVESSIEQLQQAHEKEILQLKEKHSEEKTRLNKQVQNNEKELASLKARIEELEKIPSNEVAGLEGDEGIVEKDAGFHQAPTYKYGGFGEDRKNAQLGPIK